MRAAGSDTERRACSEPVRKTESRGHKRRESTDEKDTTQSVAASVAVKVGRYRVSGRSEGMNGGRASVKKGRVSTRRKEDKGDGA